MWLAILLFAIGLFLSATFSGSETGFYRASRLRIAMNVQEGDRMARLMSVFTNQPAVLIATVLIGNNCANYLLSLSVILFSKHAISPDSATIEIAATFLMTPFIFVYGELLPKSVFYKAPNLLFRWASPLLAVIALVLSPAILLLWGLSRFTEWLLGQSPERVSMALAREELQRALDEGQQVGILHPSQRLLAQNFAEVASRPIRVWSTPSSRVHSVPLGKSIALAIRLCRRFHLSAIVVSDPARNEWVGYVRLADLLVNEQEGAKLERVRPLMEVRGDEPFGEVLLRMQMQRVALARIVNQKKETMGIVSLEQLIEPLLKGPLGSLKP